MDSQAGVGPFLSIAKPKKLLHKRHHLKPAEYLELQEQAPDGVPYILLTADRYQKVLRRWRKLGMADDKWENRFVVNNVRRSMKVHFRRAEIELDGKFSIHTFRKSYGQNQANAGIPIKTLQHLMGHEDEKTALTYWAQVEPGEAAMSANTTDRLLADAQRPARKKDQ